MSVINSWTVVSFWDQSGDSRPASNSSFVMWGVHDFRHAAEAARQRFPTIFARPGFPVLREAAHNIAQAQLWAQARF
jgi:hypothetical protein